MKLFLQQDIIEIRDIFSRLYYICSSIIMYIHTASSELTRCEEFDSIDTKEIRNEITYLFFAVLDDVLSTDNAKDVDMYISKRAYDMCAIGYSAKKSDMMLLDSFMFILLAAYSQHLGLNWYNDTKIADSHKEKIDICLKKLEELEHAKSAHVKYCAYFNKQGHGVSTEVENVLSKNHRLRFSEIKLISIALDDIINAFDKENIEDAKIILRFLDPIFRRSYGSTKERVLQIKAIQDKIRDLESAANTSGTQEVYYSFLKRHQGVRSDKEVVARLKERAEQGATALARYLASSEGKMHFDFTGLSHAEIIRTINKEIGTNIEEQAFQRAITRNRLIIS